MDRQKVEQKLGKWKGIKLGSNQMMVFFFLTLAPQSPCKTRMKFHKQSVSIVIRFLNSDTSVLKC